MQHNKDLSEIPKQMQKFIKNILKTEKILETLKVRGSDLQEFACLTFLSEFLEVPSDYF